MTVKQIVYFLDVSLLIYLYVDFKAHVRAFFNPSYSVKFSFLVALSLILVLSLRFLALPVCNVSFKSKLQIRENSAHVCMLEDSMSHEIF